MANGGIIGPVNKASFGKCTVTTVTATGCFTTQPGTTLLSAELVAGGGSGNTNQGGGGGAGGFVTANCISVVNAASYPITIGAGGTGTPYPSPQGNDGNPTIAFCQTATGGGGGGGNPDGGRPGGSGGGAGGHNCSNSISTTTSRRCSTTSSTAS